MRAEQLRAFRVAVRAYRIWRFVYGRDFPAKAMEDVVRVFCRVGCDEGAMRVRNAVGRIAERQEGLT